LESTSGRPIAPLGQVPVAGEFEQESSTVATKHVDLGPHYPLLDPGRYAVSASVELPGWGARVESRPLEFDVIEGTVLWQQVFGVPPTGTNTVNSFPEQRRYALQQALHLDKPKLYVRVSNLPGDRVFAVYPLGPMLTFSAPEHQIDRQARLHVLYQYAARSFYYYAIAPDGHLLARRTFDYAGGSRPELIVADAGMVLVRGGVRHRMSDDFPAEPMLSPVAPTSDAGASNALTTETNLSRAATPNDNPGAQRR
jgi:hypothetical protein